MNMAMIAYLIIVRPFKEENQRVSTVVDEVVIATCVCLFVVFLSNPDMTEKKKKDLGWLIIGLILFSVVKNFAVVLYFGYMSIREKLRQMFDAEDEQADSPTTEDHRQIFTSSDEDNNL